ncbi:uncharacterized protein DS421_19g655230 [Arachis hypogaea]|uniref:Uncharacterized protein n=1 Tax=Arachis hypogaea TaxID=3818 RepID=A0A6B9VC00_ARAHY|nr:uncharacterized protein DS421_19g655230 [Arachis hypogaea]
MSLWSSIRAPVARKRRVRKLSAVEGRVIVLWFLMGTRRKGSEGCGGLFMSGGSEGNSIRSEFMPVGADGRFSLLNAEPQDWIYDWGFHEIDKTLLHPVIQALQPIANITVESQVLYYTPKSSFSYWDDIHGSHIFSTKDLPFFVYTICKGMSSAIGASKWRSLQD